ncbi:hypothetical protein [Cardiobacterium hominis]|uniref:hypothetical protein n=1 Tax=Cardiobacterium hominis TaxID=2718 RepID=UPI0028E6A0BD|nr:hypothetical protein [Cardiobacterium hominis]
MASGHAESDKQTAADKQNGKWTKDPVNIKNSFDTAVGTVLNEKGKSTLNMSSKILGGSIIGFSIFFVLIMFLFCAMRNRNLVEADNGYQLFRTIFFSVIALVVLMTFIGFVSYSPS